MRARTSPFFATRIKRRLLGHGPGHLAVGIHIVEEYQLGVVLFAGVYGIFHHHGPIALPNFSVVLEPGKQVNHFTASHRFFGLRVVEQVGMNEFVRLVYFFWFRLTCRMWLVC